MNFRIRHYHEGHGVWIIHFEDGTRACWWLGVPWGREKERE